MQIRFFANSRTDLYLVDTWLLVCTLVLKGWTGRGCEGLFWNVVLTSRNNVIQSMLVFKVLFYTCLFKAVLLCRMLFWRWFSEIKKFKTILVLSLNFCTLVNNTIKNIYKYSTKKCGFIYLNTMVRRKHPLMATNLRNLQRMHFFHKMAAC